MPLSTLVSLLNERFGTEFGLADQLFFDQVRAHRGGRRSICARPRRPTAWRTLRRSSGSNWKLLFVGRMDGNEGIFQRLMNDEGFRELVASYLVQVVYEEIRGAG